MMTADHEPLGETAPPVTWNPLVSSSIAKVNMAAIALPALSIIPVPLLDRSKPLTLNDSPAIGLSVIVVTVRFVGERTIIVFI